MAQTSNVTGEYRMRVRKMLMAASRWLERNADQLSGTFSGGCTEWSVTFSHNSGEYPTIEVRADKVDIGMCDALTMKLDVDE